MTAPPIRLRALLAAADVAVGADAAVDAVDVDHVTFDSRAVRPGTLFVAAPGATAASKDGHAFVDAAVRAGAAAIIAERAVEVGVDAGSVPVVVVAAGTARAVGARLAEALWQKPSAALSLCGVTGTNGKTTTTYLLASIVQAAHKKGAVFGTLGIGAPEAPRPSGFTTPEAEVLSQKLRETKDAGFDVVAMEVTSIALATRRVEGLSFAAAGFTNLSHDHLDFHGTFDAYFAAKERLFTELLPQTAPAVLPAADDEHGFHRRLRNHRKDALTWGLSSTGARVTAHEPRASAHGLAFELGFDGKSVAVSAPGLLGAFNLENALVAAGLALGTGFSLDDVARGLAAAVLPPGRMQRVAHPSGDPHDTHPVVVVDYAHTPDALERALLTTRSLTSGKLYVVFGCGGDRDATKRPVMGRIAADVADAVVLTDDNPRSEASDAILDAVEAGLAGRLDRADARTLAPGTVARINNRRVAIRAAVDAATGGDIVVVAGKGHEKDQTGRGPDGRVHKAPFDDVREAEAALAGRTRPAFVPRATVEAALGGAFVGAGSGVDVFAGVATDSRAIEPGALFVPLSGDRFDGHEFVEAALARGAAASLVERRSVLAARSDLPLLVVDDALAALQRLAHAWLMARPAVRIALTGSNGKTTTKELIAAVLGHVVGKTAVTATEGNLNNHIGVPLTALRVEDHHRFAVLEMGMNHLGEIASYCTSAPPQIGLVTNMGTAHAGNVGGVEGVARAKGELFDALPKDGVAVVNADDARCLREAQARARCRHLSFGRAPFADVRLTHVSDLERGGQALSLAYGGVNVDVTLALDGRHNAENAAGAVAVAVAAGLDFATAVAGLAFAHASHGRLERRERKDGLLVLDDTYNANPDSMEAGLFALQQLARGRPTFAALGQMLELGEHAPAAHKHIGAAAAQVGIRTLFCCGELGRHYEEGARGAGLGHVVWAADSTALAPLVRDALAAAGESVVLVKGSRGARMERVVDALLPAGSPALSSAPKGQS